MFCELFEHEKVDDEKSGFQVCQKCGLVFGAIYVGGKDVKEKESFQNNETIKHDDEDDKIDTLREILAKLHIEGEELAKSIANDYKELSRKQKKRQNLEGSELLTVSIYESLKARHHFSPSLIDISNVTMPNMKKVWKLLKNMESKKNQLVLPLSPQDLIRSKIGYLNLSQNDLKAMETCLEKLDYKSTDFSSRSIASALMFEYMRSKKIRPCTLSMISHLFSCSAMSAYRYRTYLKKSNIKLFQ